MTRAGSLNSHLGAMAQGEYLYLETTLDNVRSIQRMVSSASRWPKHMEGWQFTTKAMTGVGPVIGDVTYLVRIERTI